jgi:hypothetical protein
MTGSKYTSGSKYVSWHPAFKERMLKDGCLKQMLGIRSMLGKMHGLSAAGKLATND